MRGQLEGNPKFAAIDKAVGREGWKIVLLNAAVARCCFRFNLLNYGFGLTAVTLRDYALATWIGITPGTVLYVYIGSIGGNLATAGQSHRTPAQWALNIVGLAATVAVAVYASRITSARAQRKTHRLESCFLGESSMGYEAPAIDTARRAHSLRLLANVRPEDGKNPSRRRALIWS